MTGGQPNEGGLTAQQIARELLAMGVEDDRRRLRPEGGRRPRAPSRRGEDAPARRPRRRPARDAGGRGRLAPSSTSRPAPPRSAAAASAAPSPTPTAGSSSTPTSARAAATAACSRTASRSCRSRPSSAASATIDQSTCNKDFSCLDGFCPSFVTLEGARVKKAAARRAALPDLPTPTLPAIRGTYNIVVTGVGGTGVVTVGALIAMAAHLEGKGAGEMEMAGLAQKGGAVQHPLPDRREALRHLGDPRRGRRGRRADRRRPRRLRRGEDPRPDGARPHPGRRQRPRDRHRRLHPRPRLPPADRPPVAGAARPARRRRARHARRDAARREAARRRDLRQRPDARRRLAGGPRPGRRGGAPPRDRDQRRQRRGQHRGLRDRPLGGGRPAGGAPRPPRRRRRPGRGPRHHRRAAGRAPARSTRASGSRAATATRIAAARAHRPRASRLAMAKGYHKLLAYKDEYEVARLHAETLEAAVDAQFTDVRGDALPPRAADPRRRGTPTAGRSKRVFGPWMLGAFGVLSRFKWLRGTPLDPFGYTAERRMERALIADYEQDMDRVIGGLSAGHPRHRDRARRASAGDPRLRPVKAAAAGRGRSAARGAQGGVRGRRLADAARGGVGRCARSCARGAPARRPAPPACRSSGRWWCPATASQAVQGEAAFLVRTLPAPRGRRAARGRRRRLRADLEPLHRDARHAVAARGAELRPAVAGAQRRLQGRRPFRSRPPRILTRWQEPPGYWGYPGFGLYPGYPWGWGAYGPGYPVSDYPNLNITLR